MGFFYWTWPTFAALAVSALIIWLGCYVIPITP